MNPSSLAAKIGRLQRSQKAEVDTLERASTLRFTWFVRRLLDERVTVGQRLTVCCQTN